MVIADRAAASMLEASFGDVVFEGGKYMVKGAPAKALNLAAIAGAAYGEGLAADLEHGLEASEFWRPPGGTVGAGLFALILVSAAYMAETLRAGIQAVPKGQAEAARSLGMSSAWTTVAVEFASLADPNCDVFE